MNLFCVGLVGLSLGLPLPRFNKEEVAEDELYMTIENCVDALQQRTYMPKESNASTVRGVIGPPGSKPVGDVVDMLSRPGDVRGDEERSLDELESASSENREASGGRGVIILPKFVTLGGGVGRQPMRGAPRP